MTLKEAIVEPLLKLMRDIERETRTRPILTIDVHGVLFGELLKEIVAGGVYRYESDRDSETLLIGTDITIRSYAAARGEMSVGSVREFIERAREVGHDALGVANDPEWPKPGDDIKQRIRGCLAEFEKGCSNTQHPDGKPEDCPACVRSLVDAVRREVE